MRLNPASDKNTKIPESAWKTNWLNEMTMDHIKTWVQVSRVAMFVQQNPPNATQR